MAEFTRRRVLQATAGLTVATLGGCTSRAGLTGGPDETSACSESPDGERPSADVYISEVLPNPGGSDDANLNGELVLIEVTHDAAVDLTGYSLVLCGQRRYEFPNTMSDVAPGSTVVIRSGEGEFGVDASAPPEYNLFVGATEPLLSNEGMQLSLRTPDGETLDTVRYPALNPGERYVRPE